jgi:hypothetical protein
MGAERRASLLQAHPVLVAFAALALIAGPITSYAYPQFFSAMRWQTFAGGAFSSGLTGIVLLLVSVVRRQRMLDAKHWLVLLVLLLPQWLALPLTAPYIRSIAWLHETRWGVAFLLSLAAPLWLALLSALQIVSVEVPRVVVAASIAGIGAACLVIPIDAYSVSPNEAPVLLLELSLSILVVFTWAYAAPRLASAGTLATAGSFLLLSALGNAGFWVIFERGSRQAVDWREVVGPLLVEGAVTACSWWLWFWLLERMTLAAFSMRALAAWTATMVPGFVLFGFLSWRIDAGLAIAVAAILVALRARSAEEQPMALGLRDT